MYSRDALRFCFGLLIQQELDAIANEWNNHRIRRYNLSDVPGGIPEILYHLPETAGLFQCYMINEHLQIVLVSGAIDCKQQVDMQILVDADRQWTMNVEVVSEEYSQYAQKVTEDYNMPLPQCWYKGLELFFFTN